MGENSSKIGKKLELYCQKTFEKFGYEILIQDKEIKCTKNTHKNSEGNQKRTHGVDVLLRYENPFLSRKEAIIIECKNREWDTFNTTNVTSWIEELNNTIECSLLSPSLKEYFKDSPLVGGILLYNSSDGKYDVKKAKKVFSEITIPKRRNPIMMYLADNSRIEKWNSLLKAIYKIKHGDGYEENSFNIVYPSICDSRWNKSNIIAPYYLFSDFIFAHYTKKQNIAGMILTIEVKIIFAFEPITAASLHYILSMINELQIEAQGQRGVEVHIYFYPESEKEKDELELSFYNIFKDKEKIKYYIMENDKLALTSCY